VLCLEELMLVWFSFSHLVENIYFQELLTNLRRGIVEIPLNFYFLHTCMCIQVIK
jgi:hypothetical protein